MNCANAERLEAYVDGELDALAAAELERHWSGCAECAASLRTLRALRATLRTHAPVYAAGSALRRSVSQSLDLESALAKLPSGRRVVKKSFSYGVLAGLATAAVIATVAIVSVSLLRATALYPLSDQLLSAHLRSLMPQHLLDVVSSDQHTVKPWFAGHVDASPVVADFSAAGFALLGGRADYIADHRAAVLVYRHGAHVINVFSWPAAARDLPRDVTRNGYQMLFARDADLHYALVSDTGLHELLELKKMLLAAIPLEQRE